jgi:hypothetical protein
VNGHDEAIGQLTKIIAVLMGRLGETRLEISDEEAAKIPPGAALSVQRGGFSFSPDGDVAIIELHGVAPAAPAAQLPKPDPADRLPRVRNPRIGCEQMDGTWIHGRPHDCPKSARGFR